MNRTKDLLPAGPNFLNRCLSVAAACAAVMAAAPSALADPPSVRFRDGALVSPSTANSYYSGRVVGTIDPICPMPHETPTCASGQTPEIREVAKGLGANRLADEEFIRNAFTYVFNTVETTPAFGLSKGGFGAMIDHYGTAFDQAQLLVLLLRQDSTVSAQYKYGTITLNQTQFKNWLGADNALAACMLLANGGIPASFPGITSCDELSAATTTFSVTMSHVWVEATGGGTFSLDPAYKTGRTASDPLINIETATGLNATTITATRNAVFAGDSPADGRAKSSLLDRQAYLDTYSDAVEALDTVLAGLPADKQRLVDVLGGLQRPFINLRPTESLPGLAPGASVTATWANIPNAYRTIVKLTWGPQVREAFADELYGHRMIIANWGEDAARDPISPAKLFVDYLAFLTQPTSAKPGSFVFDIDHPYAAPATSSDPAGTYMDRVGAHAITKSLTSAGRRVGNPSYIDPNATDQNGNLTIVFGLGQIGQHAPDYHRQRMMEAPLNTAFYKDRWRPLASGHQREVMVQNWLHHLTAANAVFERVAPGIVHHHHSIGFLGDGYLGGQASFGGGSFDVESGMSTAARDGNVTWRNAIRYNLAATLATLENLEFALARGGIGPGHAAPTRLAGYIIAGTPLDYLWLTSPASAATFDGEVGNTVAKMNEYIAGGFKVMTHQYLPTAIGVSLVAYTSDYGDIANIVSADEGQTQFIKGADAVEVARPNAQPEAVRPTVGTGLTVDEASGQPMLRQTDMVVGAGAFPQSLPFTRTYSPADRLSGYLPRPGGWKHIYDLRASVSTDLGAFLGQGRTVPARAAVRMLAGARFGLMSFVHHSGDNSGQLLSTLVIAEALRGSFSNVVSAQTFEGTSTFYRRDKAGESELTLYINVPAIGNTDTLRNTDPPTGGSDYENGGWHLVTKAGIKYRYLPRYSTDPLATPEDQSCDTDPSKTVGFNASLPVFGAIHAVYWPDGTRIQMSYDNSCLGGLRTVQNSFGRTLTFTSTDSQTLAVTDGTGRSVVVKHNEVTLPNGSKLKYEFTGHAMRDIGYANPPPLEGSLLTKIYLPESDTVPFAALAYDDILHVDEMIETASPTRTTIFQIGGVLRSAHSLRVNALSKIWGTTFDQESRSVRVKDPTDYAASPDDATLMAYDYFGRLAKIVYPERNRLFYAYDAKNNRIEERIKSKTAPDTNHASDIVTTRGYGPKCTITDWAWGAFQAAVPACYAPGHEIDPRTAHTFYYYNAKGQLTELHEPCPTPGVGGCPEMSSLRPKTIYGYTDATYTATGTHTVSHLTSTVDPTSLRTEYQRDTQGNVITVSRDPSGFNARTYQYYDSRGDICAVTDPRGVAADATRPVNPCASALNHAASVRPYLHLKQFDLRRNVVREDKPYTLAGVATGYLEHYYTPNGQLSQTTDFESSTVRVAMAATHFKPDGKPWRTFSTECFNSAGVYIGPSTFDADGRPATDPGNCGIAVNVYNTAGELERFIDARGIVTKYGYDDSGRQTLVTSAFGTGLQQDTVTTTYTRNGQTGSVTDANKNVTGYVYDDFDRLYQVRYPVSVTCTTSASCTGGVNNPNPSDFEQYEYDVNGNVIWVRTRAGNWVGSGFDHLDREMIRDTRLGSKTGTIQRSIATTYDLAGRILAAVDTVPSPDVEVTYTYDALKRIGSETLDDGTSRTIAYAYDLAGNRTSITWPGSPAFKVNYAYDGRNSVTAITKDGVGTPYASYLYDKMARRTQAALGSGKNVDYAYSLSGELSDTLKQLTHRNLIDSNADGFGDTDAVWGYTYNVGDMVVTKALPTAFQWQPTSSPSGSDAYGRNSLNQYTAVDAASITHDAAGNLTGDGIWTFTYDAENRMTGASKTAGGTVNASYAYDPLNRRYKKTVGGTTTLYLWAGDEVIAEYVAGVLQRRTVPGVFLDEPVVTITYSPSELTEYYHADLLGSVIAMANTHSHTRYTCSAFGEGAQEGDANGNAIRFAGRQFDLETGLYYNRARMYSPTLGRFMQTDPIGYDGGMNLYAYVGNDPTNARDPFGLMEEIPWPGTRDSCTFATSCTSITDPFAIEGFINQMSQSLALSEMINQNANAYLQVTSSGRANAIYPESYVIGAGIGAVGKSILSSIYRSVIFRKSKFAARAIAPSSRMLGRALEAAGHARPPGSAAHHIVAGGAQRAAPARAVLDRFGIGINDAANGAFLPSGVHARIHTNAYYDAVNGALSQATTRQEALQVLDAFRLGLP